MPSVEPPIRVAIVGGGCAALTTAFELSRPEHEGRYAVTVYQMGFRLGGKGASGRGIADRIEEHGLHLWMGFYENAFRLMRETYAEAARDPAKHPIATWQDAFKPAPQVAVTDRAPDGEWALWIASFGQGRGLPGDPLEEGNPLSVRGYLQKAISLILDLLRSAGAIAHKTPVRDSQPAQPAPPSRALGPEDVRRAAETIVRYGQLLTAAAIFEASEVLRAALDALFPHEYGQDSIIVRLVDVIATAAKRQLEGLVGADEELRRVWQVIDLMVAIVRGSMLFGLAVDPRGFDAINDYDWRQWLRLSGASEATLDSGFVRGIYDLVFAYEDGNVDRPKLAAGVALRGATRMFFTYRGSLFWRMSAGMGDVVFAPLYEVLSRRGVRFKFFHRLRNVKLSSGTAHDDPHVEALEMDVQARTKRGKPYRPLVDVHGVPSWPSKPDFSQLVDGAAMERDGWQFESPFEARIAGRRTLRVGRDFDLVVLGVPVGTIRYVCAELLAHEPRWREMVHQVKTVATQAYQVWMRPSLSELGWTHGPVNLSGWVEPFDTWADMSHLIPAESWGEDVGSIAYFCSVLNVPEGSPEGDEFHAEQKAVVRDNALAHLTREMSTLWPELLDASGRFRWSLLAAKEAGRRKRKGPEQFDTQFWTANVHPSERYTLSLPGTIKYRISPLDMTFDNLTIAGDWTHTGLDSGCVESAVMSGLLAAHALSHSPPLESIVGYDHP